MNRCVCGHDMLLSHWCPDLEVVVGRCTISYSRIQFALQNQRPPLVVRNRMRNRDRLRIRLDAKCEALDAMEAECSTIMHESVPMEMRALSKKDRVMCHNLHNTAVDLFVAIRSEKQRIRDTAESQKCDTPIGGDFARVLLKSDNRGG